MPWIFGLISYLALLVALPFLLLHPKLRGGLRARLGFIGAPTHALKDVGRDKLRVWVHGASAGDILALLPTVRHLRAACSDIVVMATTVTNSGMSILDANRELFVAYTFLPFDVPSATRRTVAALSPDIVILEYTELWPNLIRAIARRNVPLVLHNGRLSGNQLRRYRTLFWFTGNLLTSMRLLLMRDAHEVERALSLHAPSERVILAGNTKFDRVVEPPPRAEIEAIAQATGFPQDAFIWVAGSTHEGEEEHILRVYEALRRDFPRLRLIIAPRYSERGERVAALAARRGLRPGRRSQNNGKSCDVFVLDSIGELLACYAIAQVVFVGGSLVTRGGQNILEPAACGKAVLFGPYMHNFVDAMQVLLGRGGILLTGPEQLERVLRDLIQRPEYLSELGAMAKAQVSSIGGAAKRNAEAILQVLRDSASSRKCSQVGHE